MRHGPTKLYPNAKEGEVTLTTTKHQEVMKLPPNSRNRGSEFESVSVNFTLSNTKLNRRTHADLTPYDQPQEPFYWGESNNVLSQLPTLSPYVLYIFESLSFLTNNAIIEGKLEKTGLGVSRSGGRAEGKLDSVILQDAEHLIPMEKIEESVDKIRKWIGKVTVRSWNWKKKTREECGNKKELERSVSIERFMEERNGMMAKLKAKL